MYGFICLSLGPVWALWGFCFLSYFPPKGAGDRLAEDTVVPHQHQRPYLRHRHLFLKLIITSPDRCLCRRSLYKAKSKCNRNLNLSSSPKDDRCCPRHLGRPFGQRTGNTQRETWPSPLPSQSSLPSAFCSSFPSFAPINWLLFCSNLLCTHLGSAHHRS